MLFCQMDVTGRTEADPAAGGWSLAISSTTWPAGSRPHSRQALYAGDPAGKKHLEAAGIAALATRAASCLPIRS